MDATSKQPEAPTPARRGRAAYRLLAQAVRGARPPYSRREWDQLARAARRGDLAARDELYRRAEPWLRRRCASVLRQATAQPSGRITPADVQQQLFLVFCTLLRDWQPTRAPFVVYVGAVLPNRLRHYLRAALRVREVPPPPETGEADDADASPATATAPDPAATADVRLACAAALAALDPVARRLVVLHVIEDQPMAVVATRLGLSERAAWRLYATTRRALQIALADLAPRP